MDGTLIASEPFWMDAERRLVESYGLTWTEQDAVGMVGLPLLAAGEVIAAHGVPLPAQEIADRLVLEVAQRLAVEVPWQPGALELLAALAEAGVPSALATMSYRVPAAKSLAQAPRGFAAAACADGGSH